MASHDPQPGLPPVDPDFARLFRDEAPAAPAPTPAPPSEAPPPPVDEAPPVPAEPPTRAESSTDTGRLFRSQGVTGTTTALLAVSSHSKLRTLARTEAPAPAPAMPPSSTPVPPVPNPDHTQYDDVPSPAPSEDENHMPGASRQRSVGLTATAVYLLIIGVTVVVAFVNALLMSGKVSWPTGIAMLAVTVFCALKVRRDDDITVIITPPIAFFIAALTAAQLFLGEAQRSLVNRAVVMFFTLADNWIWIIGSTIVAAVIVLVRRRK